MTALLVVLIPCLIAISIGVLYQVLEDITGDEELAVIFTIFFPLGIGFVMIAIGVWLAKKVRGW